MVYVRIYRSEISFDPNIDITHRPRPSLQAIIFNPGTCINITRLRCEPLYKFFLSFQRNFIPFSSVQNEISLPPRRNLFVSITSETYSFISRVQNLMHSLAFKAVVLTHICTAGWNETSLDACTGNQLLKIERGRNVNEIDKSCAGLTFLVFDLVSDAGCSFI